jgi:hypothetical protein
MSDLAFEFSKSEDAARIRKLWEDAVETVGPKQTAAKAPLGGFNLRLNVLKALQATYETAKVAVKALAAAHVTFDPVTWLDIGIDALAAVQTIIASLVQTMLPIEYITYVMLAQTPTGITEEALRRSVEDFIRSPDLFRYSWHLGMTESMARRAWDVIQQPKWLDTTLEKLTEFNMVDRKDDLLIYRSRNMTLTGEE